MSSKWKINQIVLQYKKTRSQVKKLTKKCLRDHERDIANDKKNPKRLYAYLNKKKTQIPKLTSLYDETGNITSDKNQIANTLNQQFKSAFNPKSTCLTMPEFKSRTTATLKSLFINEASTLQLLKKLDPNKSIGPDEVSPYVLHHSATAWAFPLSKVFQLSLDTGSVPSQWLKANVTPLFKKGSVFNKENYRPISLTSVPCKILERFVRDCLMSHLREHNLIAKEQHGFVTKRSCTTNLLETADIISFSLAKKKSVDLLFLDFAKAFDKVDHTLLLHKLKAYGIEGNLLSWFSSFLSNRSQRVAMGETFSDWMEVTSGVPQGSVIGPALFVIFINDLPEVVHSSKYKIFADDTKIISELDNDGASTLQSDIDRLLEWTNLWKMELNFGKCKILHFGKNNPKNNFYFNCKDTQKLIEESNEERDLGILTNSKFKFQSQCSSAAFKASRVLGQLKQAFHSRDSHTWKKLYATYVRPHLEYAVQAWSPYYQKDVSLIEKVQRRATRIPSDLRGLKYNQRLAKLGLQSLKDRRLRGDLIQWYKYKKGLNDITWTQEPVTRPPRGERRGLLVYEQHNSKFGNKQRDNFFTNRIARSWNSLSDSDIEAPTVNSFKAALDRHYRYHSGPFSSGLLR